MLVRDHQHEYSNLEINEVNQNLFVYHINIQSQTTLRRCLWCDTICCFFFHMLVYVMNSITFILFLHNK